MSKFKIGDTVRVISDKRIYGDAKHVYGQEGVVFLINKTHFNQSAVRVEFKDCTWTVVEDALEYVKQSIIKEKLIKAARRK